MRKGQITFFFVLGIVLFIFIGVFYFFQKTKTNELGYERDIEILEINSNQIKEYIEKCMYDSTLDGIYKIASGGGYLGYIKNEYTPLESIEYQGKNISLWYLGSNESIPNIETIEQELSYYVKELTIECVNQLVSQNNSLSLFYNYDKGEFINETKYNVNVKLNEEDVEANFNFQINLNLNNAVKKIEYFETKLPYNLKRDFELAKLVLREIIESQPDFYDIRENCMNYNVTGYQTIISTDLEMERENHITLIKIFDYEPNENLEPKAIQIIYAVRNLNVMGQCT